MLAKYSDKNRTENFEMLKNLTLIFSETPPTWLCKSKFKSNESEAMLFIVLKNACKILNDQPAQRNIVATCPHCSVPWTLLQLAFPILGKNKDHVVSKKHNAMRFSITNVWISQNAA